MTSNWRTPENAGPEAGRIGPNAVLQLLPVVERVGGRQGVDRLMAGAGLASVPDGSQMIPEGDAVSLHRQLRRQEPALAEALAAEAGRGTADYILAHRIPRPAQLLLRALPPRLAAPLLSRSIARHAWTFAGSGRFRAATPWRFEIADNPFVRGESSDTPLCAWHAAVFERLYDVLVAPGCRCLETACGAQGGNGRCRFEIVRHRDPATG